jgi:hypothetical protein
MASTELRHKEALMRSINREMINASRDVTQRNGALESGLNRCLIFRRVAVSNNGQREYGQRKGRACSRQVIASLHSEPFPISPSPRSAEEAERQSAQAPRLRRSALIAAPMLARHRANANVQGFVKAAYGAAIGTILGACVLLGRIAIGDWLTALIGLAADEVN